MQAMGTEDTTAQVHPAKLTAAFVAAAERQAGSRVRIGTVTGVRLGGSPGQRHVEGGLVCMAVGALNRIAGGTCELSFCLCSCSSADHRSKATSRQMLASQVLDVCSRGGGGWPGRASRCHCGRHGPLERAGS